MAPRLRVGIDARHVRQGLGIGVFIASLSRELSARHDIELEWLGERGAYPLLDLAVPRRRPAFDVVHFTGNTGWPKPGPVPFVLTVHDLIFARSGLPWPRPRALLGHAYSRWVVPRAVRAAAAVAVPSAATAREVAALGPRNLRVIPNGVDAPGAWRAGAIAGRTYLLAFAGRDPRKQTSLAIEALALIPEPVRLVVLAAAGLPRGFRRRMRELGVEERVEIRERVDREALWRLLGGALALVYPSADEGFGMPVLEAMTAGTPAIAGPAPAVLELGGNALLPVDPARPAESIAEAVATLRCGTGMAVNLAERGRRRAGRFSWRTTAAAYARLYREVAA